MTLTLLLIYIVLGLLFSEFASLGHRQRYGRNISAKLYCVGIICWLPMLLIGRRKKT